MIAILSNREYAVAIWGLLFLAYECRTSSVRTSIANVFKAFFASKVILTFVITISYISLLCWIFSKFDLWDISMLKDTALYSAWSIAVIIKVIDDRHKTTFKEIATENIAINATLAAIIDFYSFSLPVELLLVPITSFIIILEQYSRKQEENKLVNKFLRSVVKIIFTSLFAICIYKIIQEPTSLFSRDFVNSLMLPIILTLLLMPYYYLLSLYADYKQCFVVLKVMSRGDVKEYKFRRDTLLKICRLNLKRLKLVKSNWRPALCETDSDFLKEIEAVSKNKRISYYGE